MNMKIIISESQLHLINEHLSQNINTYNIEMVSIQSLEDEDAIGEDRVKKPIFFNGVNYSENNIKKLMNDIQLNGFKEPCIMAYDPAKGEATIIEGNHRIEAAKRLGLKEVPVQLNTMRIRDNHERAKDNMFPLSTGIAIPKHTNEKPVKVSDLHFFITRPIKPQDFINNLNESIIIKRSFFEDVNKLLGFDKNQIFYHGTNNKFNSFDIKYFNMGSSDGGWLGKGFYFTNDYSYAESYANNNGSVKEVSLNIKNSYIITDPSYSRSPDKLKKEFNVSTSYELTNKLISLGYDSVMLKYSDNEYDDGFFYEICVFDNKNINIVN